MERRSKEIHREGRERGGRRSAHIVICLHAYTHTSTHRSAPHSVDHILEAMFDGVISPGYLIRTGVSVLSWHTCRWNTLQASRATAEVRRWPPCEGVVHLPREGGVATGQLGGAEWAGWWSGWFVTVLEGEEGATWNGAGGREEGKGRGGGWEEEGG